MGSDTRRFTVDTTEVWEVWNSDLQPHNFHIHDVQFQILEINGEAPAPELSGWKDTVYIPPGAVVTPILRFAEYAAPLGRTCMTATCSGTKTKE
ncbi:multicopper oxidase domain-containing protein [Rhodococcus sp. NPDC057014]|uniref:multicopper oxidase domain-containing protein n=1 Tax=Rhodococcus sp. NPDC057014 TaxID=3346000 RepID=UPI0036313AB7